MINQRFWVHPWGKFWRKSPPNMSWSIQYTAYQEWCAITWKKFELEPSWLKKVWSCPFWITITIHQYVSTLSSTTLRRLFCIRSWYLSLRMFRFSFNELFPCRTFLRHQSVKVAFNNISTSMITTNILYEIAVMMIIVIRRNVFNVFSWFCVEESQRSLHKFILILLD